MSGNGAGASEGVGCVIRPGLRHRNSSGCTLGRARRVWRREFPGRCRGLVDWMHLRRVAGPVRSGTTEGALPFLSTGCKEAEARVLLPVCAWRTRPESADPSRASETRNAPLGRVGRDRAFTWRIGGCILKGGYGQVLEHFLCADGCIPLFRSGFDCLGVGRAERSTPGQGHPGAGPVEPALTWQSLGSHRASRSCKRFSPAPTGGAPVACPRSSHFATVRTRAPALAR